LAFPKNVDAGIRVAHIGKSSVRYEIGLFEEGEPLAAAGGHFVHVYVDRDSRRPTTLPAAFVVALQQLVSVSGA
jgi:acyl-CoA thioester hydrolase